jgi:ABC-type transport system involved in multi-copper enzyme maturation permease subunit
VTAPVVDDPPVRTGRASGHPGAPPPRDWEAIRTIVGKDLTAVRRSKAITLPMAFVPIVLLVILPIVLGSVARSVDPGAALQSPLVRNILAAVVSLPEGEQLPVLILGYLLSPLLLVLPLMVSAVLAADAFAGEKERRTLESLLHLPISDRDLFTAKLLSAYIPALAITWGGALLYAVVANLVAWSSTGRLILPFVQWTVMVVWVAPALALLSLGLLVVVSSRAKTSQEANQLGGAVILPLIFLAASQVAPLLLAPPLVIVGAGAGVWLVAGTLVRFNGRRFTRDRLATAA